VEVLNFFPVMKPTRGYICLWLWLSLLTQRQPGRQTCPCTHRLEHPDMAFFKPVSA